MRGPAAGFGAVAQSAHSIDRGAGRVFAAAAATAAAVDLVCRILHAATEEFQVPAKPDEGIAGTERGGDRDCCDE